MLEEYFSKFANAEQLLPAVVQDMNTKEVLMLAWVNRFALEQSIQTKKATFWSRSRNELWIKGQTSGNVQEIVAIKYDCDADSFLFMVKSHGPACHTGNQSCFHKEI